MSQDNYEFTEEQNGIIGALASAMSFVGIVVMIAGVLGLLGGGITAAAAATKSQWAAVGHGLGQFVGGALYIYFGNLTRNAATGFENIVKTQGNDIGNLMSALGQLKTYFTVTRVILIVAIVLNLLAFIGGFVGAMVAKQ